jgi:hypothetical protein
LKNESHLYITSTRSQNFTLWHQVLANQALLACKNENIIPCVMRFKELLMLWQMKKIVIDADDETDLKTGRETSK